MPSTLALCENLYKHAERKNPVFEPRPEDELAQPDNALRNGASCQQLNGLKLSNPWPPSPE